MSHKLEEIYIKDGKIFMQWYYEANSNRISASDGTQVEQVTYADLEQQDYLPKVKAFLKEHPELKPEPTKVEQVKYQVPPNEANKNKPRLTLG